MKREFKIENGKRYVKAVQYKYHTYHIECAPGYATGAEGKIGWFTTSHSSCKECRKPLFKK